MLQLAGVSKHFPGFQLKKIELEIKPGEYFVILGPTGSGKTALLETIAGMYRPDEGRILFDGDDITDWPPERRRIGFVYQDYDLFPHLSVRENILFGLRAEDFQVQARKLAEMCRWLGITHLLDRDPARLSGGEKQRTALARAMIVQPKVLLLDEPFSALDPETKERFLREWPSLHREMNALTIHVTHDFDEAALLADRIAVLHQGRVEQAGSPWEIFHQPSSLFTARFAARLNVFQGVADGRTVGQMKDTVMVHSGAFSLEAITERMGTVGFVVSPEAIQLSPEPLPAANCLEGRITTVRQRRLFWEVGIDVGEELWCYVLPHQELKAPNTAWVPEEYGAPGVSMALGVSGMRVGEKVWVHIPPQAVHVFPLANQTRFFEHIRKERKEP